MSAEVVVLTPQGVKLLIGPSLYTLLWPDEKKRKADAI
jgi:hypothetical protein